MKRLALAAVLAFGFAGAAQAAERTEQRTVPAFTQVRLEGAAEIHLHQGAFALSVSGPDEEVSRFTTRVEDGTLVLRSQEHFHSGDGVTVEIAMPQLKGFEVSGAGDTQIEGFRDADLALTLRGAGNVRFNGSAKALKVDLRGAGNVTLEGGKADQLAINLAGIGHVKANGLEAKNAKVKVGGTGSVDFTSNGGAVEIDLSGLGNVHWRGNSKPVSIERSGLGSISHDD